MKITPASIRERANQLVAKWEKILEEHEENLPDAVPHIEYQLAIARAERDVLGDDPSFDEIV